MASVCLAFLVMLIIIIVKWPTFKKNFDTAVKRNSASEAIEENYDDSSAQIDIMSSGDVNGTSYDQDNFERGNADSINDEFESVELNAALQDEENSHKLAPIDGMPKAESEKKPEPVAEKQANYKIYFVKIGPEGSIEKDCITRTVRKSDSPLTEAIRQLLAGPQAGDGNCITLIPKGTKLLGASVKNGVATLNFSEEFEFLQFGSEGAYGQLKQVVWTATEFSTVKSVLFLIEGEQRQYLGSEGVEIGGPISRSSFGRF